MRRYLLPVVVCLVAILAGCTTQSPAAPVATSAAVDPRCPGYARLGGTPASFGPGGVADLVGIMFGGGNASASPGTHGTTGIVFAHEADDTSCDWLPTAAAFAGRGYRTLVFDFSGFGASPEHIATYDADVMAAAAFLSAHGVTSTVLVGASMGGTAVLAAAARITPPVAGVLALSAPVAYGAIGAGALPPAIPVLLMCGAGDSTFASDARTLDAMLVTSQHKKLVLVDSSMHGFRLVRVDGSAVPQAQQELDAFLAAYAPPT